MIYPKNLWIQEIYPQFIFVDGGTWHVEPDTWTPETSRHDTWHLVSAFGTWYLAPRPWNVTPLLMDDDLKTVNKDGITIPPSNFQTKNKLVQLWLRSYYKQTAITNNHQ